MLFQYWMIMFFIEPKHLMMFLKLEVNWFSSLLVDLREMYLLYSNCNSYIDIFSMEPKHTIMFFLNLLVDLRPLNANQIIIPIPIWVVFSFQCHIFQVSDWNVNSLTVALNKNASANQIHTPSLAKLYLPFGYGDDRYTSNTVDMLRSITENIGPVTSFTGTSFADNISLKLCD